MAKIPFQQDLITHYIGVDGGGTKTRFALFEKDGKRVGEIVLGTCHFAQIGFEAVGSLIKEGVDTLLDENKLEKEHVVVGLGLAGYGREQKVRSALETSLEEALVDYLYVLANDVEVALYGALGGEDGIVIISGTGSIAFAKQGDETIRCGGWGYLLGDEGSGYDMGRKTLSAFAKQADGRLPRGPLYDIIMQFYSLEHDFDLISKVVNNPSREQIASFSRFAFEAAKASDESAFEIFEACAKELATLANTLANDLVGEIPLSYIGGVFQSGHWILDPLKANLDSRIKLHSPKFAPEYGAYLLAKEKFQEAIK